MKLLVLSMNFSPELTGIGRYSGEMVHGLASRGHEVKVVCAPPYYPAWQVRPGYAASAYTVQQPQPGLTVYRCPLWVPRHPSGSSRLLHQASFALASLPLLLWLALSWRPAVVFVVAPAVLCAPGAWLAARLAAARAWLHVQDLELDAAFSLGLLRGQAPRRAALALERALLRRFDRVTTISCRMLRQLACKGVDLARAGLLPNWVDLAAIHPHADGAELRRALGIAPGQRVALYSGTMNRKQGLPVLVEAAHRLQARADIVFVLCGEGEVKPALLAAASHLANVRFLDLQPAQRLDALLCMADLHLLPQLRGAADLVLPSKLGGMLASGRPVVAAAEPGTEVARIVGHCGLLVAPECAAAFAAAVADLCTDDARRCELGAAARRVAEHALGKDTVFDRLSLDLQALAAGPATAPAVPRPAPP